MEPDRTLMALHASTLAFLETFATRKFGRSAPIAGRVRSPISHRNWKLFNKFNRVFNTFNKLFNNNLTMQSIILN